jgi:hypothetical protein
MWQQGLGPTAAPPLSVLRAAYMQRVATISQPPAKRAWHHEAVDAAVELLELHLGRVAQHRHCPCAAHGRIQGVRSREVREFGVQRAQWLREDANDGRLASLDCWRPRALQGRVA